jgi:hypothetical protein
VADEFRNLAQRAPGFAGIFFDDAGRLTISVAVDAFSPAATAEVLAWAASYSGAIEPAMTPAFRRVEYDYLSLDRFYQALRPRLTRFAGVTSSRIDETTGRIVVTVSDLTTAPELHDDLKTLGMPPRMLVVEQMDRVQELATLRNRVRPAIGGLEINKGQSGSGECTLGFNVYKKSGGYPDPGLGRFFMTASHCANARGTVTGTVWGQPDIDNAAGVEVATAAIYTGPTCPHPSCTRADVVVAQYFDSVASSFGVVAKVSFGLIIVGSYGVSGNIQGAVTGETVRKVGRTTGQTIGTITAMCVDINTTQFPDIWNMCQQRASLSASGGDSGSPVFIPYNAAQPSTTPRSVGILWGAVVGANPPVAYLSPLNEISNALSHEWYW